MTFKVTEALSVQNMIKTIFLLIQMEEADPYKAWQEWMVQIYFLKLSVLMDCLIGNLEHFDAKLPLIRLPMQLSGLVEWL